MADIVSAEERSRNMAAIRNRDTKPEVYLRKLLLPEGIATGLQTGPFPGTRIYFFASIIQQFLYMAVSGTGIRVANMRTRPNPVLSSGRRSLMIMSDGMLLSGRLCRKAK